MINLLNWQSNRLPYWQLHFNFIGTLNMDLVETSLVCLSRAARAVVWTLCDTGVSLQANFQLLPSERKLFQLFSGKSKYWHMTFCFQPDFPSLESPKWQARWQLWGHLCFGTDFYSEVCVLLWPDSLHMWEMGQMREHLISVSCQIVAKTRLLMAIFEQPWLFTCPHDLVSVCVVLKVHQRVFPCRCLHL